MICDKLSDCINYEKNNINAINVKCNKTNNCILVADKRSNIKCEENRKVYNLENPQRKLVILYKMDGGVIEVDASVPDNICKCDYLYITECNKAILVELKGKNVKHALEQIEGTMTVYKDILKNCNEIYARVIVSSAIPRLNVTPQYTRLLCMLKKLNGNLKVKENKMSEKIDELSLD